MASPKNNILGFIGAGQMARALAAGFVRAKLVSATDVHAADPSPSAREGFASAVAGAGLHETNRDVVEAAGTIFLAVKPQQISPVLGELGPLLDERHLVVSIAAGVSLSTLAAGLDGRVRLVRVMPNTPCMVGLSASAYSAHSRVNEEDVAWVDRLLSSVGIAFSVEEKLLDAVTGLSGSGPAFVYSVIEALRDGGISMGLSPEVASALAAQTVRGAAEMVLATGELPSTLKDRVSSPGGTTIAGLKALDAGGCQASLIAAVEAATNRSVEMGRQVGL